MKKFFVSMGLAAAGTAGLHAAYAPDLGPLSDTKVWNVSATLRGFYDDNYDTANSGLNPKGSYGFEVSPQLVLAVPLQQTELGLRNTYSMTYYQERESLSQNPIDQSDQLDLWVDHAFTERWQAKVMDTFVVAQEPQLLNPNGITTLPIRVTGDNIVNTATINLNTDWTRQFSTSLTYQNSVFDYQNSGATITEIDDNYNGGPVTGASLAGLLNRVDQSVSVDFQWRFSPETMGFFGGSFELVNYIGNEPIAYSPLLSGNGIYYSDDRDNRSYFGYVGIQHNLLPNLNVTAKVGAQYTEDYNDPLSSPSVSPYAVLSVIYTYSPGSYAEVGLNQQRNATDVIGLLNSTVSTNSPGFGKITQDQESTYVYGSINHQITPKLLGTLIGSWQYSTFEGGAYNNTADNYYSLGLNLSYTFTPHISADAGYNFDDIQSDIYQRGYTRNRVYIGVTASY
ncbi:MAG: outer membrane beta-barrel protein [Verrucomicrobiota bacterium]